MQRTTSESAASGKVLALLGDRGASLEPLTRAARRVESWTRSTSNGRRPTRRRLAVVFSGGATRGAYQVGVIDVLARQGIVPDLLVGASVGAINAAYWAFHPGEDVGLRLLGVWRDAARARVLPDRPLRIIGNLVGSRLHERSSLARILERELPSPASTIESARLPLHIVACNLRTGMAVDFDRGVALPALLASAAIPGLFPPVMVDGDPHVDGGVVANCPIEVARMAGATDVLAIDLVGRSVWVPAGGFGTLERAINLSLANQTERELESLRGTLRIALLRPGYDVATAFGDFSQTLALFRQGRLEAERFLAEHWLGAQQVRPGVMELEAPRTVATVAPGEPRPRRLRLVFERVRHRTDGAQRVEPTMTPAN